MDWDAVDVDQHQLTVLVTDIRGSSGVLNPAPGAVVRDFIREFAGLTNRMLAHHGGSDVSFHVNAFVGDGFLIFPADPAASSAATAPARAVEAALEMRTAFRALCRDPRFRPHRFAELDLVAGVTYGPVFYGRFTGATVPRSTGIVSTVGLAFRLAQHAEPGQVLVSDAVQPALPHATRPVALADVKGFSDVTCYEVIEP